MQSQLLAKHRVTQPIGLFGGSTKGKKKAEIRAAKKLMELTGGTMQKIQQENVYPEFIVSSPTIVVSSPTET